MTTSKLSRREWSMSPTQSQKTPKMTVIGKASTPMKRAKKAVTVNGKVSAPKNLHKIKSQATLGRMSNQTLKMMISLVRRLMRKTLIKRHVSTATSLLKKSSLNRLSKKSLQKRLKSLSQKATSKKGLSNTTSYAKPIVLKERSWESLRALIETKSN